MRWMRTLQQPAKSSPYAFQRTNFFPRPSPGGGGTIREHVSAINAIPGVNWQLPPLPNLRACHTVTWHQSELHKRLQLIHKQRDSHVPIP